jgi:hypothetical protein
VNDPFSKTSTKHDPNAEQVVVAVDTKERLVIDNENPPKKTD